MTRPDPRRPAAVPAAFAGALDLSSLKRPAAPSASTAGPSSASPAAPGAAGPAAPAGRSPFVVDVSEADFGEIIQVSNDVLVVIDLWATWCEPCKQLSPVLERLAAAGGGSWILAKVDVDANPRIAQAFGVQSIPTVVAVAAGQPVDAFNGALPEPEVRTWITGLLDALRERLPGIAAAEAAAGGAVEPEAEPEDDRFTAAEDLLAEGDFAAAQQAYQAILDVEPTNEQARAALAQAEFLARVDSHAPAAIDRADADPSDATAQLDAADVQLAQGDIGGAFDRLVASVRRSAGDERTAARERLLSLFGLFPADDEQVVRARRALAAALY